MASGSGTFVLMSPAALGRRRRDAGLLWETADRRAAGGGPAARRMARTAAARRKKEKPSYVRLRTCGRSGDGPAGCVRVRLQATEPSFSCHGVRVGRGTSAACVQVWRGLSCLSGGSRGLWPRNLAVTRNGFSFGWPGRVVRAYARRRGTGPVRPGFVRSGPCFRFGPGRCGPCSRSCRERGPHAPDRRAGVKCRIRFSQLFRLFRVGS